MDYIQGERFIYVSDLRFYCRNIGDMNYFEDNLNNDSLKGDGRVIIYTHTHFVDHLFGYLNTIETEKDIILVTHNSDMPITQARYDSRPSNIIKWYSQNVVCIGEDIESIPIGLENSRWFKRDKKIFKLQEIIKTEKQTKNLVYLNLNIKTNPPVRQGLYNMLQYKNYVTAEYGKNGARFDNYLNNLYNHSFMICPEGNGIDVHQPWEAMYVNTIPIQKKNRNNENWRELPVCWVDDWAQLEDESFLLSERDRIENGSFDLSKLNFSYWKDKILNSQ